MTEGRSWGWILEREQLRDWNGTCICQAGTVELRAHADECWTFAPADICPNPNRSSNPKQGQGKCPLVARSELSMGPFCVTRPNPTHK